MGFYKNRLTITITANLNAWYLNNNIVEGTISKSIDENEYPDDVRYMFINVVEFHHYEAQEGHWPAHYLLKTNTDRYFMCKDSEQIDAPLA